MGTAYSLPVILIISSDISKTSFFKRSYKGIYHLLERPDGKSSLELAKSTLLDLIILDTKFVDMPAFDLCRAIRKIANYLETPIFLITNNLKKTFIEEALQAGVSDFLNEPLDKQEIDQRFAVSLRTLHRQRQISEVATKPMIPPPSQEAPVRDKAFKEFVKTRKTSELLSILMIELDALDKMKPTVAEEAFFQLSFVLQHSLRKYDILIPQSPGKFIVMLPKTSKQAAHMIAEMIRSEVTRIVFETPLSASIGLVTLDHPDIETLQDFNRLLEKLSQAVTEAKKTGNRVVITTMEKS